MKPKLLDSLTVDACMMKKFGNFRWTFVFFFFCLFPVLPAGAVDMARGSTAETGTAVFSGSAGRLHWADPYLGLQASPVGRVGGLCPRSLDCLLGGESAQHRRQKTPQIYCFIRCHFWSSFFSSTTRPFTFHPCLEARGRTSCPRMGWTEHCRHTRLSARPAPVSSPSSHS